MKGKPSLHGYIASVTMRVGEPREIHYDSLQCVSHGFMFVRADGSGTFIAGCDIAEIDIVKSDPIMGHA